MATDKNSASGDDVAPNFERDEKLDQLVATADDYADGEMAKVESMRLGRWCLGGLAGIFAGRLVAERFWGISGLGWGPVVYPVMIAVVVYFLTRRPGTGESLKAKD